MWLVWWVGLVATFLYVFSQRAHLVQQSAKGARDEKVTGFIIAQFRRLFGTTTTTVDALWAPPVTRQRKKVVDLYKLFSVCE